MGDKQWDKKKKKLIGSYLFSSIKFYTPGISQNCHLEARTNLKNAQYCITIGLINMVAPTAKTFLQDW
jgi:hypothetical protein